MVCWQVLIDALRKVMRLDLEKAVERHIAAHEALVGWAQFVLSDPPLLQKRQYASMKKLANTSDSALTEKHLQASMVGRDEDLIFRLLWNYAVVRIILIEPREHRGR